MTHETRSIRRVVLLGITAAVFAACSTTGAASPTAKSAPTAAALPDGVAYTNEGPLGATSPSAPGVAGTYQSDTFKPVVRLTVGEGWSGGSLTRTFVGAEETHDGLPLTNGIGGIVLTVPTSIDPPAPGDPGAAVPADLLAWIEANPNLELGPATDVTIGGVQGQAFEGTLSATADVSAEDGAYRIVDFLPLTPAQTFRLAVVVVNGQQLIVATIANTTNFAAFSPAADAVVATLTFPAG